MLAIRHAFRGRSELCRRVTQTPIAQVTPSLTVSAPSINFISASLVSQSVPDTKKAPFRIARAVRVNTPSQRRVGRLERQFATRGKFPRTGHLRPPSTWEDIKDLTPAGVKLLADSHVHLNTARRFVEEVRGCPMPLGGIRPFHACNPCMHALLSLLPTRYETLNPKLGHASLDMPARKTQAVSDE